MRSCLTRRSRPLRPTSAMLRMPTMRPPRAIMPESMNPDTSDAGIGVAAPPITSCLVAEDCWPSASDAPLVDHDHGADVRMARVASAIVAVRASGPPGHQSGRPPGPEAARPVACCTRGGLCWGMHGERPRRRGEKAALNRLACGSVPARGAPRPWAVGTCRGQSRGWTDSVVERGQP